PVTIKYASKVPAGVPAPVNAASFTSTAAGTYTVTITVPSTTCSSPPDRHTFPTRRSSDLTVNSSTICAGGTATITATPSPAGTYNYKWTGLAGVPAEGTDAGFRSKVAGTYTVTITDPATTCSSAPASGTVTVNPLPTVTVN